MRTHHLVIPALAAGLVTSAPASALERAAVRLTADRADGWDAGITCTVRYYNICTGWLWILSGFEASDQFGVHVDGCGGVDCRGVTGSWHYFYSGTPAGWGFTGAISVSLSDANCCPTGVPLQSTTFLPVAGWNVYGWSAQVPGRFIIHTTLGPAPGTPLAVATDHPGAAAGGPPACGTCYPTSRVNHSYYYGPDGSCPGAVLLNDGVCDAQLLWDCDLYRCKSVEPRSWGLIKNLYR